MKENSAIVEKFPIRPNVDIAIVRGRFNELDVLPKEKMEQIKTFFFNFQPFLKIKKNYM
jgi:hypothetical protein